MLFLILYKATLAFLGSLLLHIYLGLTLSHRRDDAGESFIQSARHSAKWRETTNPASATHPQPTSLLFLSAFYHGLPRKSTPSPSFFRKPLGTVPGTLLLVSPNPLGPFQEGPACWIFCKTPLSFMAHVGSMEPDDWWVRVKAGSFPSREQQEPQGGTWGWVWSSHQVWFHRRFSLLGHRTLFAHCPSSVPTLSEGAEEGRQPPPQLESLYLFTEHGSIFPKCPCH